MRGPEFAYRVAIIGAGFCGTLTAINLLRRGPRTDIFLIERNDLHGPGLAYGTIDRDHLLNVRAGQMGALSDDPGHFWQWLQNHPEGQGYTDQSFVPRHIYGKYLKDLLAEYQKTYPTLHLLNKRIIDIDQLSSSKFQLVSDNGEKLEVDKVVLALGNFPPEPQDEKAQTQNPYAPEIWRKIADDGDVLVVGTGLTSLDIVVTLSKIKEKGTLHLLSRHGLLPQEHAVTAPYEFSEKSVVFPKTALALFMFIRREIASAFIKGISWHSVIDALRPYNQKLWQDISYDEKRRFLRHLRAYWDVHRHRCATEIMEAYRKLEREGRLQLHHGSIITQKVSDKEYEIEWRPRGKSKSEHMRVRHVVRCTGPQADFGKLPDPLVQNMLSKKLIAPDMLRMGIATNDDYIVLDKDGAPVQGLYALGSVLKGRLYESVAVPELRVQASAVAESLTINGQNKALFE